MSEIKFSVTPTTGVINTNMATVKEQLMAKAAQYEGVVFTEDSKIDAKKTVAEFRKIRKEVDDSRKEVKRQWLIPYGVFEDEVKGLLKIIDKPIEQISGQVEAFEQKRLEERNAEIKIIYDAEIGDLEEFLPLHRIRDEKWQNATVTIAAIKKAMIETILNVRSDKAVIESMQSGAVPAALKKFQVTLNLADAITYINQYEAQRARMLQEEEEYRRKQEEQQRINEIDRAVQKERQRIADEERIKREAEEAALEKVKTVDMESAAPLAVPDSHTAVYTVVGTDGELCELEMAMVSLGLYYERKDI